MLGKDTIFVGDVMREVLRVKPKKTRIEARAYRFLDADSASVYGLGLSDGRVAIWSERATLPIWFQKFVRQFAIKTLLFDDAIIVF